jgi:hypothetical protein
MREQVFKLVHRVHDNCGSTSLLPFKKNIRLMASPKVFLPFKLPKHLKNYSSLPWGGGEGGGEKG